MNKETINILKNIENIDLLQDKNNNISVSIFDKTDYNKQKVDINEILTNFDSYSNLEKIKAIRILYQNGFRKFADNCYKKYSKILATDRESAQEFKTLSLNRKLYINQGKNFQ